MIKEQYFTAIVKDLEQAFWDERGLGARYRTTLVGVNYFRNKYGADLLGKGWSETLRHVLDALVREGIVEKAGFKGQGNVLKVEFRGCLHWKIEEELAGKGIPPFSCPCANVVMHYLDSLIGSNSELVSVELEGGRCAVTIGIVGSTLEEI